MSCLHQSKIKLCSGQYCLVRHISTAVIYNPENTIFERDVDFMSGQRLRRWTSIKLTLLDLHVRTAHTGRTMTQGWVHVHTRSETHYYHVFYLFIQRISFKIYHFVYEGDLTDFSVHMHPRAGFCERLSERKTLPYGKE